MKFMMRTTNEYERLVQFFVKNGLEFDGDEEVDTDIVKCWKISQAVQEDLTHIKDAHADGRDTLVAGCVLALREGRYIIDGIAVDPALRKAGLGKMLVDKAATQFIWLPEHRDFLENLDLKPSRRRTRRISLNASNVRSIRSAAIRRL